MPGARSPDETGMLKMAPLGQSFSGDSEDEGSETRFFTSAPPPSQGPPTSAGVQNPMPEGPTGSPPAYGGAQQNYGTSQGNYGTPQQNSYQGGQSQNPPQQSQMAIGLGDAAGGGYGGGNAGTPFNSANVNSNYVDNDEATGRTGSMRVYLLVSILFFMVSSSIIIALWFLFNNPDSDQQVVEEGYNKQAGYAPIEPSEEVYEEPEPEVEPVVTPTNRRVRRNATGTNRSGGSSNTGQSAAPSAPASGTLTVRINSSLPVGELEVTCGGTRIGRTRVTGGVGSFSNVPNGNCELFFKPTVAKYQGQLSGRSLTCTIAAGGATVSCN